MTDKDRQPWSVRGVTGEARARAARAAHRRRMTIGEWVTETILKAAARDLGETGEAPGPEAGLPAVQAPPDRALAGALGALVQHLENDRGAGMAEVARRVERTEAVLTGRMEQIAAAMYGVMQTVERRAMATVDHDDSAREAAVAAEQARLAEQVARLAGQESRRQDQMAAIAEALTLLAGKVDAAGQAPAAPPEPEPVAPAFADTPPEPAPPPAHETAPPQTAAPAAPVQPAPVATEPQAAQPRPRHSVHHDPRAEEVAAEIRMAARRPPEMPEEDPRERRRGLFGRLLRRD